DVAVHVADEDYVTLSCDETTTTEHLDRVLAAYTRRSGGADGADDSSGPDGVDAVHAGDQQRWGLPEDQLRTTDYLTHPVFHRYRSETAMMRYLRHLAGKDYALDRGMIPLGSCTMKLNAVTEMAAVTWPQFADVHPYAPAGDVTGYLELIDSLQTWLARLTSYAPVSVQPNAGSTKPVASRSALCAWCPPARTARTPPQRCSPGWRWRSWPLPTTATWTPRTCAGCSLSTRVASPRSW